MVTAAVKRLQNESGSVLLNKVLESQRLSFLPINEHHADTVHREYTSEIAEFLYAQPCPSVHATRERIKDAREKMGAGRQSTFAVFNHSCEFVGCADLRHYNLHPRPVFWVCKTQQQHGYGTEILSTLHKYSDMYIMYNFLQLIVAKENHPAINVIESLGARKLNSRTIHKNEGSKENVLLTYRLFRQPVFT